MYRNRVIKTTYNNESCSRDSINNLVQQGRIAQEGNWYRIHDLDVLRNELLWLIKNISISRQGTLVKLYN